MSARVVCLSVALWLLGCVNEHALELDLVAADPIPSEVVSYELRLLALDGDGRCPTAQDAAAAAPVGRLAHAQSFSEVGMAIGEVPQGRWAFVVLGRDAACGVRVHGCTAIEIGPETFTPIPVRISAVTDVSETCGSCRACEAGVCAPVQSVCE
ncbi:MAG TPA: hypothetical protein ENK57_20695 [Polyangiaceae bacterium]|nr:hypothetical protein [Polyangiaceae bacterium]